MTDSRRRAVRRTRFIATVSALVVAVGLAAPVGAATIAGTKCTGINITKMVGQKRYTCTKSGGQLRWKKNTSFVALMPISFPVVPSTAPDAITFDNLTDRIGDIHQVAWQKTQDVLTVNAPIKQTVDVFVGPHTKLDFPGGVDQIRATVAATARLLSGFGQSPVVNIVAYNARDVGWAIKKWSAIAAARHYDKGMSDESHNIRGNCQSQPSPGQYTGKVTRCTGSNAGAAADSNDAFMKIGMVGDSTDLYFLSGSLIAHEYMHTAQSANWIGTCGKGCSRDNESNVGFAPCWINEGQPNILSRLVTSSTIEDYLAQVDGLPYGWGPTTVTDYSQPSLYKYLVNQKARTCYENGPAYKLGYSIGALTTEALVAIAGPQATMALYALGADGYDFPTAFKKIYGIEWTVAAQKLSVLLAAEYALAGPAPK